MKTIEEKAKAYDEALLRADEAVQKGFLDKDMFYIIFPPEESEDERMGDIILEGFKNYSRSFSEWNNVPVERIIAYLERQKEIPMPNSTELIEMWHKAKAILKEKDFRGDEWRLAQNAFMDGFAIGTCVKFEKQKEQKPEEWSEEDERRIDAICELLENTSAIHPNYSHRKLINWLKSLRPQPKQEWSEEDERILKGIIGLIDHDQHYGVSNNEMLTWLKSLCPDSYKNCNSRWKPSEDEERLINTSISFLKDFADKGYENAVECIDWLKSKLNGNTCK